MTYKAITLKFVVPTAVVLGIILSIGAVYLKDKYLPINHAEANHSVAGSGGIDVLPNSYGRFSRVHVLLSGMRWSSIAPPQQQPAPSPVPF
jgi:hypothetical protein